MIDGVTAAASTATPAAPNPLGGMGSEAFLKLLVAQLRYQDPTAPADGSEMLQQTAQFTQVETLQRIAEMHQQLLGLEQVDVATGLLGQQVTALGDDGESRTGTVDGLRFTADGPVLLIDGTAVPLDRALEVHSPGSDGA